MLLQSFGISHIGFVRPNNEDVWDEMSDPKVYLLADGMGGHNAGEVAANEAVNRMIAIFKRIKKSVSIQEATLFMREAFFETNEWVYALSHKEDHHHGMGTTLCSFWLLDQTLIYGHVGDSRIYRFADGKLTQLSKDHSLREEYLMKGYTPLPSKNIITRAIGTTAHVEPDVSSTRVFPGEIYFLCSDGLTDYVSSEEISYILKANPSLPEASEKLIEIALSKGGNDNITIVMIKLTA